MPTVSYDGPPELRTRGTVVVVPGRGETQAVYARLARRLAADSYQVRVIEPPAVDPDRVPDAICHLARTIAGERDHGAAPPFVLLGADTGALLIAAVLASDVPGTAPPAPDAVVLAGLPGREPRHAGTWADELDARTHCPVHRGTLTGDAEVRRGALSDAVPGELADRAYADRAALPHLVLLGDLDTLAARDETARLVKELPAGQLALVAGAHHDVLNDQQHRSVAAAIVTFLERLRESAGLEPVVRVEYSAW
jgi:alpha-beta hydrolase superfamily lysophospholipase